MKNAWCQVNNKTCVLTWHVMLKENSVNQYTLYQLFGGKKEKEEVKCMVYPKP